MHPSTHLMLTCLVCFTACAESQPTPLASLGWVFNYQDWTDPESPSDPRTCENQKPQSLEPAYPAVSEIKVILEDPQGAVQGFDATYACAYAYNAANIRITGIVPQTYNLRIEAKSAQNTVLYQHTNPAFNIETPLSEVVTLQAATGETTFYLNYPDVSFPNCPAQAHSVHYTITPLNQDGSSTQISVENTVNACSNNQSPALVIREIPVLPYKAANNNYINPVQKIDIEVKDIEGRVLYQGTDNRTLRPGNNSINAVFNMQKKTFPSPGDTTTTP
jgi:hypothetical protein